MITLNNINLSSIDLLGIDLRGIKLGLGGRGSGSGDGFPVLPGDVTRWHFGGLTNEMMAAMDNPRLEDADGKGRFLSFKNFAWKEGSGISDVYPGFILGDGVDDFAVTENNLDLEDTYTIYTPLILLKYGGVVCGKNSDKDFSLNTVISSKSIGFDSANAWSGSIPVDLFEFVLVACKRSPQTMYVKDLVTGKSNQNKSKEFVPNPRKYFVWRNVGGSWCQVAIAGQIICNGYYSTDEDDEKVLDWYKKQYPWLFFDQAWTVVGKTNEDEDRATIANITGNGNDLILSNFGFAEGSGYNEEGEYAGYLVTDGVDDKIVSSSFGMGKDFTIVGDWKFIDNKKSGTGLVKGSSFYIYNTMIGLDLYINSGSVKNSLDGIKSINAAFQMVGPMIVIGMKYWQIQVM